MSDWVSTEVFEHWIRSSKSLDSYLYLALRRVLPSLSVFGSLKWMTAVLLATEEII